MKQIDLKSVIIGILGTVLIFVLIGATNQDKNLGDITVSSIKIVNGGNLMTINSDGNTTLYLGTGPKGGGGLEIFNSDGMKTSSIKDGFFGTFNDVGETTTVLGTSLINNTGILIISKGDGQQSVFINSDGLSIDNKHGKMTGFFGDKDGDGVILLYDRYGDYGWGKTGKQ